MKEKFKNQRGITLIALIITIIVMLILAIVSVNLIMNQGIITKSKTAVDKHQIAAEKESIQIGYSEYIADKYNGTTPLELKVANAQVSEPTDEGWIITFEKTGNVYTLSKDGKTITGPVIEENEKILTDEEMQEALQSFTQNPESYVHSEQSSENKDRAIGTDGQAVNLNLWKYIFNEETKEVTLIECDENGNIIGPGYSNDNIVNGKIKGTVPQYVYREEKKDIYTVKYMEATFLGCTSLRQGPTIPTSIIDMYSTFSGCTNLRQVSEIPNSVINMDYTFEVCTSLTQAPEIPSSVTGMRGTFSDCTSLIQAPEIPSSVTGMGGTFSGCTSLIQAPEIPSSVTDMERTFSGCTSLTQAPVIQNGITSLYYTFEECTSLTQAPVIPSSVTSMQCAFEGCTSLTQAPVIPNSVTWMSGTFSGCTSLIQAPEIPSSVTNMWGTFYGCTSLTGIIRVNAKDIANVSSCFSSIANDITVQVPANSTTYNKFNTAYGDSSNITIQTFE